MCKWLRLYIHKYKLLVFGEVSVARKERGLGLGLQRKRTEKGKGGRSGGSRGGWRSVAHVPPAPCGLQGQAATPWVGFLGAGLWPGWHH